MTLYEKMTEFALESGQASATDAWEAAKQRAALSQLGTPITREKGCPKSAFISLAQHGYISGFELESHKPLSKNAEYILVAARVRSSNADLTNKKALWWQETARQSGTTRQGQNGVLDVLQAALQANRFSSKESQP